MPSFSRLFSKIGTSVIVLLHYLYHVAERTVMLSSCPLIVDTFQVVIVKLIVCIVSL